MIDAIAHRPIALLGAALALVIALYLAIGSPQSASAHPLGNFTINRYSRLELYSDVIRVNYVLDMAEIPTFQEMETIDTDGDGTVSAAEADAYATAKADDLASNVSLILNGQRAGLRAVASDVTFPEGQGGLDTTRVTAVFEAPAPSGMTDIQFADGNYSDRLGWKEVVVFPDTGASITGDVPLIDVSHALTSYPGDQISSPLDVTSVAFAADSSIASPSPAIELAPTVVAAPSRADGGFAALIARDNLTLGVVLVALAAAFAFGALHALEPGHGKTLVAAYFVGVKGTARQALTLGLIVAVTHAVGVLAIGLVAIFGSQFILPERLYPWLSLAAALMVLGLGLRLIAARGGGKLLHNLMHRLPFGHHHHHEPATTADGGVPPWRTLIALGLADGLTPSPSALVVLLAAVSLDRIEMGVGLIMAFSAGLATVLAGVSLFLLYARQFMERASGYLQRLRLPVLGSVGTHMTPEGALVRVLPLGGAAALVVVGLVLTVRALAQPGLPL